MTIKRKAAESDHRTQSESFSNKKQHLTTPSGTKSAFSSDLFQQQTIDHFKQSYTKSVPYKHAVVPALIEAGLLRNVRSEITTHIHFTLKETDIYRIHQSGDLANLSDLDTESLKHLPSLVRLRDALYSQEFREWISIVTGAGKLSGRKTDMAVNVYTPGSYLLCHDDVIGSRRVSYILYLTDPDMEWRVEWGGGLRLYPTDVVKSASGENVKIPLAEHELNIPPSFGQLSFFEVVPGESYHDVEEVYHGADAEDDRKRIRMAISGWYHLPQEGEDGYQEGAEQMQAQRSSLMQLEGSTDEFDEPKVDFRHFGEARAVMNSDAVSQDVDPSDDTDEDEDILTEKDLTFLLQYIRGQFLAPDMIEKVSASFEEMSTLQLEQFFCDDFARKLRKYIENSERAIGVGSVPDDPSRWKVARPPHKHRYAYLYKEESGTEDHSPIGMILVDLIHSHAFKKWLALATGLKTSSLTRQRAIARRFRRGKDYALASAFQGEQPQLEFTMSMTPSKGWEQGMEQSEYKTDSHATNSDEVQVDMTGHPEYGGEEAYMAGDDDDDDDDQSVHSKSLPQVGKKVDPAVYRGGADDEDGILFANEPAWNIFSAVLRDKGTLRFVKYISEAAQGDRWDIKGEVQLAEDAFDGEDSDREADSSDFQEAFGEESNADNGNEDEQEYEEVDSI